MPWCTTPSCPRLCLIWCLRAVSAGSWGSGGATIPFPNPTSTAFWWSWPSPIGGWCGSREGILSSSVGGGEEAAHLVARGIPVEVVPGVTAGIAAPAYAGIPVTHRRAGSSVTFVTGHEEIDKGRPGVDWRGLARSSDGLVIYMGLHNLRRICEELLEGGLAPSTPAAAIQQGTVLGQRILLAPLDALAEQVENASMASPAIIVIGAVVAQRVAACAPPPAPVVMPIPL
jgi:uroporphyrin-III C-methyltransferase